MLRIRKITLDTDTQTHYVADALTVEPPSRKDTMPNLPRSNDGSLAVYAWPGGYPLFYICHDDRRILVTCVDCARKVEKESDDVRVVKAHINWRDENLYCEVCDDLIECAYL